MVGRPVVLPIRCDRMSFRSTLDLPHSLVANSPRRTTARHSAGPDFGDASLRGEYAGPFYSVLRNPFVSDCFLLLTRLSLMIKPVGGDEGIRTPGLRLAKAALSQLSYIPKAKLAFGGPLVPRLFAGSTPQGCQAISNPLLVGLPSHEMSGHFAPAVGGPSRIRTWDLSLIRGTL